MFLWEVKCIRKRILMILLILIFFTSLGSAVAVEDNDLSYLSDLSVDVSSDSISSQDDVIDSDMDETIKDESNIVDSADSIVEISRVSGNSSNKKSKDILSSTDDSSKINNDVLLTQSDSSASLLKSPQTIIIKDASYYDSSINEYIQDLINNATAGSTIKFTGSSY